MNGIKKYRMDEGLTIRKLAQKADISIGYLSDLENGKTSNPSKETMEKISSALDRTVPEVFYPEN